jgi:hypothetical protein
MPILMHQMRISTTKSLQWYSDRKSWKSEKWLWKLEKSRIKSKYWKYWKPDFNDMGHIAHLNHLDIYLDIFLYKHLENGFPYCSPTQESVTKNE